MTEQDANKTPPLNPQHPGAPATKAGHGVLIAIIALIVVAAIVVTGIVPRLRARDKLVKETNNLAVPAVGVIQPKRGAPAEEIVLPGNIQAFIDAPIYARTNGYLKVWYSDIGAHVKKGQLLAEIDTPEVDQQLSQARADLATAQANVNLSQITFERFEGLKNTDSVSKQDVDNAAGDYSAKKAIVDSAQYNVNRLQDLQSFQKIYAPFDGVITARNTDIGQLIDSGASGGVAKELFHIAAIRTLRVYVNVPQQYSVAAKPGILADLTLAQFPGREFPGKLVRTANSIDLASRTLLVEVDVENPTGELLPGAFTEVHLKLPTDVPSFILPVTALIFRAQGLQVAVVQSDNRVKLVSISLGRDFGSTVEVASGLTGQESVIVSPPDSIIDGEVVKIAQPNSEGGPGSESPKPR
ncbi:MAG: efflux RND transporter periplasmic adaptor subunit [Candidatus Acidiferrales bacterium]